MSLDDHIKRRLENHRSEVDTDALWAALEPEVRRRRWGGFWIIPLVIAILGLSLISFVGLSEAFLLEDDNNVDAMLLLKEIDVESSPEVLLGAELSLSDAAGYHRIDFVSVPEEIVVQEKAATASMDILEKTPSRIVVGTSEDITEEGGYTTMTSLNEESEIDYQKETVIRLHELAKAELVSSVNMDLHFLPLTRNEAKIEEIDTKYLEEVFVKDERVEKLNALGEIVNNPKWRFGLGIDYSYAVSDKILSGDTKYRLYRDYSEKHKITHVIFPNALLQHKSGVAFRTGIKFTTIKEQFSFTPSTYENSRHPSSLPALTNVTEPLGMVTPLSDKEEINTYKFIDIPFLLGFGTRERKGISFLFEAGVAANVSVKIKGTGLNERGTYILIDNNKPYSIFKGDGGWSILGGVSTKYNLSSNMSLTAGMNYTHQMDSITKESYSLRQKFKILGLNLGIHYTF